MEANNSLISSLKAGILKKRVSYQKNTWSPISKEMTISEVLQEIHSDSHKTQVDKLRDLLRNDKKDEYNIHKKILPAVTFCATFNGERKKSKIKDYNSLIVLDIDKIDEQELKRIKECLSAEPIVLSFWESPSKNGLKGIVSLSYTFELNTDNIDSVHKAAFQKLACYFKEKHNIVLDNSGSDTTRLCFFSYDPFIIIKEEVVQYEITESDVSSISVSEETPKTTNLIFASNRDALYNPHKRNAPGDRHTISAIIRYLKKNKLSITHSYEEWYKVAMAIANSFTYDIGEKYFLYLSSLDTAKYNEVECKNFLVNCYETRSGAIKFKTIVYFATQKGYIIKNQRDKGSEAVDENLSHVSSSKTVIHLPEDIKE
ncbi:MAG: PriCT-2 domain-containing protein [Ignavibacteriaceae bacterium]|nr:PriCT-2 domain-containing protein [Ignavibacteriaceae bacterium]